MAGITRLAKTAQNARASAHVCVRARVCVAQLLAHQPAHAQVATPSKAEPPTHNRRGAMPNCIRNYPFDPEQVLPITHAGIKSAVAESIIH